MAAPSLRLPEQVACEADLDDLLTTPSAALIELIPRLSDPLVLLGCGGKMGPTLAVLAQRAAASAGHRIKVIAVSRFSDGKAREWLESRGVHTESCDLLDPASLERLPDSTNVIYLVGLKFGTSKNPAVTWAINTLVPANVCRRYPRARIVALSTGNVYPLRQVSLGGATEDESLTPLGEYANAAVARERVFQYFSEQLGTALAIIRLFYAVELRYGVLVDIARSVANGSAVSLQNGYVNCIWQRDANEMILRSLELTASPPAAYNLCRPEIFSVREIATHCAKLLGREAKFDGVESDTALMGDSSRICKRLGEPETPMEVMLQWTAEWIHIGGRDLGKPTHFQVRDGRY